MNENHEIYELTEAQKALLDLPLDQTESKEQAAEKLRLEAHLARLDGYLKGRADEVQLSKRGKGSNRDLSKYGSK